MKSRHSKMNGGFLYGTFLTDKWMDSSSIIAFTRSNILNRKAFRIYPGLGKAHSLFYTMDRAN